MVKNSSPIDGGGVYLPGGSSVIDSIVYLNTVNGSPNDLNTTTGVTYSCASDGNTSNGNITDDPVFIDVAGGDYQLRDSSPAIDAGTNQAWMTTALDLAGTSRIFSATVDMGAYELERPGGTIIRFR